MKPAAAAVRPAPVRDLEKRIHMRFDKLFPVVLGSELYGETVVIARNISVGGMLVQTGDVLPLGSVVTVHFRIDHTDDEIVARAEVKHHLCLNFSLPDSEPRAARAMGLRFLDFDAELPLSLPATRVLH
jgi:hypothetical protein